MIALLIVTAMGSCLDSDWAQDANTIRYLQAPQQTRLRPGSYPRSSGAGWLCPVAGESDRPLFTFSKCDPLTWQLHFRNPIRVDRRASLSSNPAAMCWPSGGCFQFAQNKILPFASPFHGRGPSGDYGGIDDLSCRTGNLKALSDGWFMYV